MRRWTMHRELDSLRIRHQDPLVAGGPCSIISVGVTYPGLSKVLQLR